MTYEERMQKYCLDCNFYIQCNWVKDGNYANCTDGLYFKSGWELGQADAFEKISEWLKDFCNEHYIMSYSDSHEVCCSELMEIYLRKMEE